MSMPLLAIPGHLLCPVAAYRNAAERNPGKESDPAFGVRKGGKIVPITYREYQKRIKQVVRAVGKDLGMYSSHSSRGGGVAQLMHSSPTCPPT